MVRWRSRKACSASNNRSFVPVPSSSWLWVMARSRSRTVCSASNNLSLASAPCFTKGFNLASRSFAAAASICICSSKSWFLVASGFNLFNLTALAALSVCNSVSSWRVAIAASFAWAIAACWAWASASAIVTWVWACKRVCSIKFCICLNWILFAVSACCKRSTSPAATWVSSCAINCPAFTAWPSLTAIWVTFPISNGWIL